MNSAESCFMIIASFLGIAVNSDELLRHKATLNVDNEIAFLLNAARKYEIKAKAAALSPGKLDLIKSPVIAKGKEGDFFIIARVAEEKALVLLPDSQTPKELSLSELWDIWDGTCVFFARKGHKKDGTFGFSWFIPTILKFKSGFITVLIAILVMQLLGLLTPVMIQAVVDKVLSNKVMSTLQVLSIGIGLVYIFEMILSLAKNYLFIHTTNRVDVMLSSRLFNHLFDLPLRYFESRRTGETVARVRELDSIRHFLTGTPLSAIIDLAFILLYIVVLFFYSTKLTLIVLASIPLYVVLSLVVTPLFKKRLDEKFAAGAETQSFLVESINGIQTIKSFALEESFNGKWGDLQSNYVRAGYKTSILSGNAGIVAQFIQKIFDLLVLFFAAIAVMEGDFTVGQLVAFRMLSGKVSGPVLRLVQLWQEYQQASLAVTKIGDIFNTPREPSLQNTLSIPRLKGKIEFSRVRFRYRTDLPEVIKDVSFTINAGQTIGVVGRSGSGKSTISKLIQRLYIPEGGNISIDGMDISTLNPTQLRAQIGVVLQENFMFSGSIAENIAIHVPGAGMERIMSAAKAAGAHEFILKLPGGYNAIIGEKGIQLSGGQKQRIAIARALLANPPILILDEATSALDYESESIIQKNLKGICENRTVLIIAHRLSTIRDVDKILVIDDGQLSEYGTHDELMKNKGLYCDLYRLQLKGDENG